MVQFTKSNIFKPNYCSDCDDWHHSVRSTILMIEGLDELLVLLWFFKLVSYWLSFILCCLLFSLILDMLFCKLVMCSAFLESMPIAVAGSF